MKIEHMQNEVRTSITEFQTLHANKMSLEVSTERKKRMLRIA